MNRNRVMGLKGRCLAAGFLSLALSPPPGVAQIETPSDLMTRGRLEADLGHYESAAKDFETVAADASLPPALRWEALVRLGMARRETGDHQGSVAAFQRVMADHGGDSQAVRFLAQAVGGVVPDDQRWAGIWKDVALVVDELDPGRPVPRIAWPDAETHTPPRPYAGQPVNLDFKDGNLQDIFRLIADVSGLNVVVYPGIRGEVTFKVDDVSWDETLDRILAVHGFGYRLEGNVLRIAKTPELGESRTYTGEIVDIEFQNQTLATVFDHIAEIGGVDFVVDLGIEGKVTLLLVQVPWDQGLDIIVRTHGLRWRREGDVIYVSLPE